MQDVNTSELIELTRLETEILNKAAKALGCTGKGGLKTLAFLKALLIKEKLAGETKFKRILETAANQGGEIMFFEFDKKNQITFEKTAKKYGLLYSIVADKSKTNKMMEIVFHSSQIQRMEHVMKDIGVGRIINEEEYIKNTDSKTKAKEEQAKNNSKKKETESGPGLNTIREESKGSKTKTPEKAKLIKEKLKEFEEAGQTKLKEKVMKHVKNTAKKMKPKGK